MDFLFDKNDPTQTGFYYVDPRTPNMVRRFDPTQPPFGQSATSCGQLLAGLAVDAVAIHQSTRRHQHDRRQAAGGASRARRRDADAPAAMLLGGLGTRAGLLNEPVAVAVTKDGTILVLENGNTRIQALDPYGNPVARFNALPTLALFDPQVDQQYLDMSVESTGYIYVLSRPAAATRRRRRCENYLLDIYQPNGAHLCRTAGVTAAKIDVDHWRNVFALNYHLLVNSAGLAEPSVSLWIPLDELESVGRARRRRLCPPYEILLSMRGSRGVGGRVEVRLRPTPPAFASLGGRPSLQGGG